MNNTALKELLGEEKVEVLKDRIIDLIVEKVEKDLEEYSIYDWLINPDEIREVVDEALEETKATIIDKYKMRLMAKIPQHFDKLMEDV